MNFRWRLGTAGSGSCTSAIGRLGASRGMVASSPTAGRPSVSIRSGVSVGAATGGADWLNVMPDDAVYPPERSIGLVVSRSTAVGESRLIRRRR